MINGNCLLASKWGTQKEEVGTAALGNPVALWVLHPVGAGLLKVGSRFCSVSLIISLGYILSSLITESKGINIFKMDFFFRNILPTYIITFPVSGFIIAFALLI